MLLDQEVDKDTNALRGDQCQKDYAAVFNNPFIRCTAAQLTIISTSQLPHFVKLDAICDMQREFNHDPALY